MLSLKINFTSMRDFYGQSHLLLVTFNFELANRPLKLLGLMMISKKQKIQSFPPRNHKK